MRWPLLLGLALSVFVVPVSAATTKDFLYRCSLDAKACAGAHLLPHGPKR